MTRRRFPAQKATVKHSILVVCEGENTEPAYFRALKSVLKLTTVDVEVIGDTAHTDPAGLQKDAEELVAARNKRARASSVERPYDEVWLVYDTEWVGKHLKLKESTLNARRKQNWHVGISRPSFEVWYLLHKKPCPPPCYDCDGVVKELKKLDQALSQYGKDGSQARSAAEWSLSEKRLPQALKNGHAQAEDCFDENCRALPVSTATSVHQLVQRLTDFVDDAPLRQSLGLDPLK